MDVREECVIAHVLKGSPFLLLGSERRCKNVCRFMVRHIVLIPVACFPRKGAEGSDCGSVSHTAETGAGLCLNIVPVIGPTVHCS